LNPEVKERLHNLEFSITNLNRDLKTTSEKLRKGNLDVTGQKKRLEQMLILVAPNESPPLVPEHQPAYDEPKRLKKVCANYQLQVLKARVEMKVAMREKW
jgi:hypothetical protein